MDQFHFFTDARISEFWGMSRTLLKSVSPIVMIATATAAVGIFIPMIIGIIRNARNGKNGKEDDDFEYREY